MSTVYRVLGAIADHILNRIAPLEVHGRTYLATAAPVVGADKLADAEANVDAWEPALAEWERELHDACALPEDQTIVDYIEANPHLFCDCGSGDTEQPVGAEKPAQGDAGADGSPITDEIATVIAVVLRGQGINSAAIYADLVARELRHHFEIFRK